MSKDNLLVHVAYNNKPEIKLVKKLAESYGLNYHKVDLTETVFKTGDYIKYAKLVVIWNGMQQLGPLVTNLCDMRNIPKCYIEWGMLPQKQTYFIDPTGFCGKSILCKDISWVNENDLVKLYETRLDLQDKYPISDEGYILVPLQIENDTQILQFTKYRNMEEFIKDIEYMYPNNKIIVKTHPQSTAKRQFDRAVIAPQKDFMLLASRASLVVGLTSTTLYEAAILGKPVVALGDHPLRYNDFYNRDRVLAGILALNIDRKTGDMRPILDRFNYKLAVY
tara:strand:- start:1313 stop:2149 length:837 start_codon:yes stop_codon:yes gene_type:complete